jgi:uncharacterized protein YegJ (DUF2314 family)
MPSSRLVREKVFSWIAIAVGGLLVVTGLSNVLAGRVQSAGFATLQVIALGFAVLMLYAGIRTLLPEDNGATTAPRRTFSFAPDDPEMNAAIAEAKSTLDEFTRAHLEPGPNQHGFLLKVFFDDEDESEHIWVADIEPTDDGFRGVIANEPLMISLHFKQPVEFEPARITDWMFIDHGKLVGGYTTRLIRQRMSPEERSAFDASVPYVV